MILMLTRNTQGWLGSWRGTEAAQSSSGGGMLLLLIVLFLHSVPAKGIEQESISVPISQSAQLRFTDDRVELISAGRLNEADKARLGRIFLSFHNALYRSKVLPRRGVFSYLTRSMGKKKTLNPSLTRNSMQLFFQNVSTVIQPGSRCIEWGRGYTASKKGGFVNCEEPWSFEYDAAMPRVDHRRKIIYGAIDVPLDSHLQQMAGAFDMVVCTQVFEHIRHPHVAVGVLFALVKAGGHLIWTAPFMEPVHKVPEDHFRYTLEGAETMLTSAGFLLTARFVGGDAMLTSARILGYTYDDLDYAARKNVLVEASVHAKRTRRPALDLYWGMYILAQKPYTNA